MTLRAAHPTCLIMVALAKVGYQLFFKCDLMPDEKSCNPLPAEDDCTPKVYERTYHSCMYIYLASNPLSSLDPLQPICTPCSGRYPYSPFYLYLHHLANTIISDHPALDAHKYAALRQTANFTMDVPWQFITISSLAGSFGLLRLAPQYSPSSHFIATFLLVLLVECIAVITWQAIIWPRFVSPLRHLPEPPVRATFESHAFIVLMTGW